MCTMTSSLMQHFESEGKLILNKNQTHNTVEKGMSIAARRKEMLKEREKIGERIIITIIIIFFELKLEAAVL